MYKKLQNIYNKKRVSIWQGPDGHNSSLLLLVNKSRNKKLKRKEKLKQIEKENDLLVNRILSKKSSLNEIFSCSQNFKKFQSSQKLDNQREKTPK